VIANALIELNPRYPAVSGEARSALARVKAQLEAEAPSGSPADPFLADQAKEEVGEEEATEPKDRDARGEEGPK
jgi:hypothetical protein